jgi:regulator of chromosome condensation
VFREVSGYVLTFFMNNFLNVYLQAENGILGIAGNQSLSLPVPLPLHSASTSAAIAKVTDIACGTDHLLILTEHGDIYSCGVGTEGQLGRKVLKRRELHGTLPEKVILGTRGRKAKHVFASGRVSFAIDTEDDVWAWGLNGSGQAGIGSSGIRRDPIVAAPQKLIGLSQHELRGATVSDIAAGSKHSAFLTNDGRFFTCGESIYARPGVPENDPSLEAARVDDRPCVFKPMLVPISEPDDPIVQISTLTAAGSLYV